MQIDPRDQVRGPPVRWRRDWHDIITLADGLGRRRLIWLDGQPRESCRVPIPSCHLPEPAVTGKHNLRFLRRATERVHGDESISLCSLMISGRLLPHPVGPEECSWIPADSSHSQGDESYPNDRSPQVDRTQRSCIARLLIVEENKNTPRGK